MDALKVITKFRFLMGFYVLSMLFCFPQAISSVFADGAVAPEIPASPPAQVEKSSWMDEQKFAEISSEIHLKHEDLEKLQRAVCETTDRNLVGRKFIEVYGPLGKGVQCVPLDTYAIPSWASVDMLGEGGDAIHTQIGRAHV